MAVNFDKHEGMGRSILEVARRMGKESSLLCTNRALRGMECFAEILETGGFPSFFHFTRIAKIKGFVRKTNPDLIHIHGGVLVAFLALSPAFRGRKVLTMYSWHHLPRLRNLSRSTWREVRKAQVLRARTLLTAVLPAGVVRMSLRLGGIKGVLTPDPDAYSRLALTNVHLLRGGASIGEKRARWASERPTIVFAGRAEMARGIDTILRALPLIKKEVPDIGLKLLLLPGPQLKEVRDLVKMLGQSNSVELKTEAFDNLASEMATCQLGLFPFKYDDTTIYPPLTVTEAMSVGLPIVYTDVRGLEGVVRPGLSGLRTDIADSRSLAHAVITILSDRSLWERLSDGAWNAVQEVWNWDNWFKTTNDLYQEAEL